MSRKKGKAALTFNLNTHGVEDFKVVSFVDKIIRPRSGTKRKDEDLAVKEMSNIEEIILRLFADDDDVCIPTQSMGTRK
jgi:hypothetical protein